MPPGFSDTKSSLFAAATLSITQLIHYPRTYLTLIITTKAKKRRASSVMHKSISPPRFGTLQDLHIEAAQCKYVVREELMQFSQAGPSAAAHAADASYPPPTNQRKKHAFHSRPTPKRSTVVAQEMSTMLPIMRTNINLS
jgi:hypothetical protein